MQLTTIQIRTSTPDGHDANSLKPVALLDQIFRILFSRARRELGEAHLQTAWQRAIGKLTGYLVFPIGAAVVLAMVLKGLFGAPGPHLVQKQPWQVVGIIAFVAAYFALYRRYREYSFNPPSLPSTESIKERRYLSWFRVIAVGVFVMMLLIAFLLHLAGR
jgi:hypothetical protein